MLSTLSALKAMLGITASADDGALTLALGRASAAVETYCDRVFGRGAVMETLDTRSGRAPLLRQPPVLSLTSVSLSGAAQLVADYSANRAGVMSLSGGAPEPLPPGYYVVAYTGGYILPGAAGADLPADVEQAALTTAAAFYTAGARDPMLRSETTEGVGSISWIANGDMAAVPPQVAALLDGHRLFS